MRTKKEKKVRNEEPRIGAFEREVIAFNIYCPKLG